MTTSTFVTSPCLVLFLYVAPCCRTMLQRSWGNGRRRQCANLLGSKGSGSNVVAGPDFFNMPGPSTHVAVPLFRVGLAPMSDEAATEVARLPEHVDRLIDRMRLQHHTFIVETPNEIIFVAPTDDLAVELIETWENNELITELRSVLDDQDSRRQPSNYCCR